MRTITPILAAMATIAAALGLSACSAAEQPQSAGSTPVESSTETEVVYNDADVKFAQLMIPHHDQAIEMSEMLLAKEGIASNVTDIATRIDNTQQPESAKLRAWLSEWGAEPLEVMDHSSHGMMSNNQMASLDSATGVDAERLFLENMIEHHNGAIVMAQAEVDEGENAEAITLAETIIATQQAEIATMETLLAAR